MMLRRYFSEVELSIINNENILKYMYLLIEDATNSRQTKKNMRPDLFHLNND